ncbi:MAG: hypothetical protein O9257_05220 [Brevundimonas sp.]|nr:hypothetical protein [Brevundimonas sp.]
MAVYLACATLVARSAKACGESFTLLTNNAKALLAIADGLGTEPISIEEIDFNVDVPKGIPFYQAHHKLSVLEALSKGHLGQRAALIDIDTFFLKPISQQLPAAGVVAYDITRLVPASYAASLDKLIGEGGDRRWYGGEFIAGSRTDFSQLWDAISAIMPSYFLHVRDYPHIGDETVVSAALNNLAAGGASVVDAATLNLAGRWWSSRTEARYPALSDLRKAAMLHLPSDKPILARLASSWNGSDDLFDAYSRSVRRKVRLRQIANPILNAAKGTQLRAPKLGI